MKSPLELCRSCGRPLGRPETRTYCSKSCGARRVSPRDRKLEEALLESLAKAPGGAALAEDELATRHETDRETLRRAARRLAARGALVVLQGGRSVEAATARGPLSYRRAP